MKLRAGQREFLKGVERYRITAFLTRRQYGKTEILMDISLRRMAAKPSHTVIFGSVKLDLGRDFILRQADTLLRIFGELQQRQAAANLLKCVDARTGKDAPTNLDDWADLYEKERLQLRLFHSPSTYSRTKIVALTPNAVGDTGDLITDEVGRARGFQQVVEAIEPIISSRPEFRWVMSTTPPPDDTHYSFALLAPPPGTEFPVNPRGNWYRSALGVHVLRVSAWDAEADGVQLFHPETGRPITADESRAMAPDKDAWDRNMGVKFIFGGTGANSLIALNSAQARGVGHCEFFELQTEHDLPRACGWIRAHCHPTADIGLGWDLATTTGPTSNPSSVSVLEKLNSHYTLRAVVIWKTADDQVQLDRIRAIAQAVAARGKRARKLCLDATNERLFAARAVRELRSLLPVEAVVGSTKARIPGGDDTTVKQATCAALTSALEDNLMDLPPADYVREDWRLVTKDRGMFVCEPDSRGRHGDTYDSTRLGQRALSAGTSSDYQSAARSIAAFWSNRRLTNIRRRTPIAA